MTDWAEVKSYISQGVAEIDVEQIQEWICKAYATNPNDKIRNVLTELDWDFDLNDGTGGWVDGFVPSIESIVSELNDVLPQIVTGKKFVEIKFCQECNNMLYPKEDREMKKLTYFCKHCEYQEDADDPCVHINTLTHEVDALSVIHPDVATDPTLWHTRGQEKYDPCPECGCTDAVYFQTPVNREKSDMRQYFVCTRPSCGHRWVDPKFNLAFKQAQ